MIYLILLAIIIVIIIAIPRKQMKITATVQQQNVDLNNKKVLIVDDNEINSKVLKSLLELRKCEVDIATSGFEITENFIDISKYELIFIDQLMPEMDGINTLIKLKSMYSNLPPTVATVAQCTNELKENLISNGFNYVLLKPANMVELDSILENIK